MHLCYSAILTDVFIKLSDFRLLFRCLTHVLDNCKTISGEVLVRSDELNKHGVKANWKKKRIAFIEPESAFGQVNRKVNQCLFLWTLIFFTKNSQIRNFMSLMLCSRHFVTAHSLHLFDTINWLVITSILMVIDLSCIQPIYWMSRMFFRRA